MFSASAWNNEWTVYYTASKSVVQPGETITIVGGFENVTDIIGYGIVTSYDTALISSSAKPTEIPVVVDGVSVDADIFNCTNNGYNDVAGAYFDAISFSGDAFQYTFTISEDIDQESITIQFRTSVQTEDDTYETTIPVTLTVNLPHKHTLTAVSAVPSTCTVQGTAAYWKCSDADCGMMFSDDSGEDDKQITKVPTLALDSQNHADYGTTCIGQKDATEETAGYTGDEICNSCGKVAVQGTVIPVLNHTHAMQQVSAAAATCSTTGIIAHWNCTKCGLNYADEAGETALNSIIAALNPENHANGLTKVDTVAATCTAEGAEAYWQCADCDAMYADEKGTSQITAPNAVAKNPANHGSHATEIIDAVAATEESTGYTGDIICSGCKGLLQSGNITAKLDHTHAMELIAAETAACVIEGHAAYWHCTKCRKNYNDETGITELTEIISTLDPDNHANGLTKTNAVAATCKSTGTKAYWTCPDCHVMFADENGIEIIHTASITPIDPDNHAGGRVQYDYLAPTEDAEGYSGDVYCKGCNALLDSGYVIPPLETEESETPQETPDTGDDTAEGDNKTEGDTAAEDKTEEKPREYIVETFVEVNTYEEVEFVDVKEDAWYSNSVETVYELGLMVGIGPSTTVTPDESEESGDDTVTEGSEQTGEEKVKEAMDFAPEAEMTIAEIVVIAARLNSLYNGNNTEFSTEGEWYDAYVDYAVNNGIITDGEHEDYNVSASRAIVIQILANCLPADIFNAINHITELPDVAPDDPHAEAIFLLYNAGILVGGDENGSFFGDRTISRAEVAALLSRIVDVNQRLDAQYD